MEALTLLRLPAVTAETGRRRSTLYLDVERGLLTKPVRIGGNAVAWPAGEIRQLNAARIAGKSEDEIRALVAALHEARKVAA